MRYSTQIYIEYGGYDEYGAVETDSFMHREAIDAVARQLYNDHTESDKPWDKAPKSLQNDIRDAAEALITTYVDALYRARDGA